MKVDQPQALTHGSSDERPLDGGSGDRPADLAAMSKTTGIAILAFEAAPTIVSVLDGVLGTAGELTDALLVADDASIDGTYDEASRWAGTRDRIDVIRNGCNLGYGGNQKVAFAWARAHDLDVLVMMHGDNQHLPSDLPALLSPMEDDDVDAVFGSRMLVHRSALRGGMPRHRYVANRALSALQNRLACTGFSEWHSGFRAYRMSAVERIDVDDLPDWFDFDCAIALALLDSDARIVEVPCTTRYADEISRVQLVRYGISVIRQAVRHRVQRSRRAERPTG